MLRSPRPSYRRASEVAVAPFGLTPGDEYRNPRGDSRGPWRLQSLAHVRHVPIRGWDSGWYIQSDVGSRRSRAVGTRPSMDWPTTPSTARWPRASSPAANSNALASRSFGRHDKRNSLGLCSKSTATYTETERTAVFKYALQADSHSAPSTLSKKGFLSFEVSSAASRPRRRSRIANPE